MKGTGRGRRWYGVGGGVDEAVGGVEEEIWGCVDEDLRARFWGDVIQTASATLIKK